MNADVRLSMEFRESLTSDSARSWSSAAIFLRAEGVAAIDLMPLLLDRCEQILHSGDFACKFRMATINFGELTLADVLRASGNTASEQLTLRLESHLTSAVRCPNVDVSAYAINACGIWKRNTAKIVDSLAEVVRLGRRPTETHATVSLRALALRSLYLIDDSLALRSAGSPAWSEWRDTLDYWASNGKNDLSTETDWVNNNS